MKKPVLLSDILLIVKLHAPENSELFVFDPENRLILDTEFPLSKVENESFNVLLNLADEIICFKGIPLDEFDLILDFGKNQMPSVFKSKEYNFINNSSKGVRWIYTNQNKNASFLSFYNTATSKAKFIAQSIKLVFKLGFSFMVKSGSFTIYHKDELMIDRLVNQIPHDDFSIFMGTAGYDRTMLIETSLNGKTTHFIKIPTNAQTNYDVANEKQKLNYLNHINFASFKVPEVVQSNFKNILITPNINLQKLKRSNEFSNVHANVINDVSIKTIRFYHLKSTNYWENIVGNLNFLKQKRNDSKLLNLLNNLKEELSHTTSVFTALAHSDFTPWNMFVSNNKLLIYDWEKSQTDTPLLFDLFHFHFQTGVLSKKLNVKQIKDNINKACQLERIAELISTYHINVDLYFKMYLLKTVSYYLALFEQQKKLTEQHQWLLSAWEEALIDINMENTNLIESEMQRQLFIQTFNMELKKTAHAFLKFSEQSLNNLSQSSDLDLVVLKEDVNNIVNYCGKYPTVKKINHTKKSFMSTVEIFFKDNSFLSLDLIHQFKRKHLQMIDTTPFLISATNNKYNVCVPDARFDFEYCFLFYTLNKSNIPLKYQEYYTTKNIESNNKIFNYINTKYNLKATNMMSFFEYNPIHNLKIALQLTKQKVNQKLEGLKNKLNYLIDTIKGIVFKKGMIITFSGVDGAGKTTIIEKVKSKLETKYRKEVILLRHRPGILPILSAIKHGKEQAEQIASVTMPRKGKNNSMLSSIIRFGYYFTDYLVGQIYVYFKYVLRGKIVLYDRYYFDFINDAKRSNIQLKRGFLKSLYLFVFKPKLNFFLYADAETILSRKKEMIAPEIDNLTVLYKNLFTELSGQYKNSRYTIIENKELDATLNKIMKSYEEVA